MANKIATTFDYIYPAPEALVSAAIFEGNSLEHFTKLYNVVNKVNVSALTGRPALQTYTCEFNADTTTSLDPRLLEISYFKVEDRLCLEDAVNLVQFSNTQDLTTDMLSNAMLVRNTQTLNRDIDTRVWISSTASGITTAGLYTLAKADGGTIKDTSTASITLSNVVERFNAFYDLGSDGLKESFDKIIAMPMTDITKLLQANLSTNGGQMVLTKVAGKREYQYSVDPDVKIIPANGLSSGQWFFSRTSNCFFGSDLGRAEAKVGRLNMFDDSVVSKVSFMAGWQYGVAADIVVR